MSAVDTAKNQPERNHAHSRTERDGGPDRFVGLAVLVIGGAVFVLRGHLKAGTDRCVEAVHPCLLLIRVSSKFVDV